MTLRVRMPRSVTRRCSSEASHGQSVDPRSAESSCDHSRRFLICPLTAANNYSFAADYGNNLYDIRHSLNATVLWEIPFGARKAVKLSGIADSILGGWEIGGILNYRSGIPIDLRITRADVVYRDTRNGNILTSPVVVNGQVMTQAIVNTPGG